MKSKKIYTCFDALAAFASQVVVHYFVSKIIFIVCQKGGKVMTNAQIAYLEHLERKRSNLVGEAETHRANVERETETHRHNQVSEAIDTGSLNVKRAEAGIKAGDAIAKRAPALLGLGATAAGAIRRASGKFPVAGALKLLRKKKTKTPNSVKVIEKALKGD